MYNSKGFIDKKIFYAEAIFGNEEINQVIVALKNNFLSSGPFVEKFEYSIAKLFNKKYAIAVNSGSSANLLALSSLKLPKKSEVITPACTFATTVAPILQLGLIPVYIDTQIGMYTSSIDQIKNSINSNTKAIILPSLIGNVHDLELIRKVADKHDLKIIDDCCDTLAPSIRGKLISDFSDITTTSFYGSHVITAMGMGGMILTNDEKVAKMLKCLRDWGRVGDDDENPNRFNFELEGISYDSKFVYTELGYNMKMIDPAAAFGLVQLTRLDEFKKIRSNNFNLLNEYFKQYSDWFYLPKSIPETDTIWLAYPLTLTATCPFNRAEFLIHLENNGIQTRVLFSGNIQKHLPFKDGKCSGALKNANIVMENGFLLGCHQGLTFDDIKYITDTCESFLKFKHAK